MRTIVSHLCLLLATSLLTPSAEAKECVAYVAMTIVRADGISEPTWSGYPNPACIALQDGDALQLTTESNGIFECGSDGRFHVLKDGQIFLDVPFTMMNWAHTLSLSEPGYYSCEITGGGYGLGIMLMAAPRFFISKFTDEPILTTFSAQAWLEGPYVQGSGMMHDQLRSSGLVPLTISNGISTSAAVLAVTGPNAVVDWVTVSLRPQFSQTVVVGQRPGLIQRDGDIVDVDGISPVTFTAPPGDYYVVISHRNHLGAMTANTIALSGTSATVDFRSAALAVYGTEARRSLGTQRLLWAGCAAHSWAGNKQISYTGTFNDRDAILTKLGSLPNSMVSGYFNEDTNLDGAVKYTGANNDRDQIIMTIGGSTPNAVRSEQMP